MIKTLFIVADKQKIKCSIWENGLKYALALKNSKVLDLETVTAHDESDCPPLSHYDLVIFNYQDNVWKNFDPQFIFSAPKSMAIISDMAYGAPWFIDTHWRRGFGQYSLENPPKNEDVFTFLGVPDPAFPSDDDRVCVLPRICERFVDKKHEINFEQPIFSTYGFPSIFKPLYPMVEMINQEFSQATFRIHMAKCDHQSSQFRDLAAENIYKCRKAAKPGIEIEFTEDWKPKSKMIEWLNESDANIIVPDPIRPSITRGAIPASIDDLVSAQRPIIVYNSLEMRHILQYVDPYPDYSIKQIMEQGSLPVEMAYLDWSAINFIEIFDNFIKERI